MPDLLYEKRQGIAYLTLNRPERRNALTPEMVVLLAAAWRDFRQDESTRVAIVTGAGDRAFCAGADLARLIPLFTRARPPEDDWDRRLLADRSLSNAAFLRDVETFKPVIAAVNGPALAGGTELVLATDIRIAATTATLGLSEVSRGLIPAAGSLARLARQVPFAKAMEILLVGEPIPAEEAHRIGLVNRVVAPEDLLEAAETVARKLVANGPLAVRKAKEAVLRSSGLSLEEAFAIENECARQVMRSEDAREGPRAFMEKRPAVFTGR